MIGASRKLDTGYTPGTFSTSLKANPYHRLSPVALLASRDDVVLVKDLNDNTYCIVAEPQVLYAGRTVVGLLRGVYTDVNRALGVFNGN